MIAIERIKKLTRGLYTTGRAFRMPWGGDFQKLHDGLAVSERQAINDSLSTFDAAIPDNDDFTSADATSWERRLGILGGGDITLSSRKEALRRKMNYPGSAEGRSSESFIEAQLQLAGYDMKVVPNILHDNLSINAGGIVSKLSHWSAQPGFTVNIGPITYGDGVFLTIDAGTSDIYRSIDGVNWTTYPAPQVNQWTDVVFAGSQFVAVAATGTNRVMTSPDGITWTLRTASAAESWQAIAHNGSLYVAVANSGGTSCVMTSPDGITWTTRTGVNSTWRSVTWGNGLFVAVANTGANRVMTSSNGTVWTGVIVNAHNWQDVIYAIGRFAAVSVDNVAMISFDGATWLYGSTLTVDGSSVTYGDGVFVIVGGDVGTGAQAGWSVDGLIYTPSRDADFDIPSTENSLFGVAFGNGLFVATGTRAWVAHRGSSNAANISSSFRGTQIVNRIKYDTYQLDDFKETFYITGPDGITRPSYVFDQSGVETIPLGSPYGWRMAYGGGVYVAVERQGGTILYSTNGKSFSIVLSAVAQFECVTYGNGVFVALGGLGGTVVYRSVDGIRWTLQTGAGAVNGWRWATWGNGIFVAVSDSGEACSSPDGITWTSRTASALESWLGVTWGKGLFVAVSATGAQRVMTSPDGITWTGRTAAAADQWLHITFGDNYYVAVSNSGTSMFSLDGITWTYGGAQHAPCYNVVYGDGIFISISSSGTYQMDVSEDHGQTWTAYGGAVSINFLGLAYGDGMYVAMDTDGSTQSVSAYIFTRSVDLATLPASRESSFKQLVLRLKQTQMKAIANYQIT